MGSRTHSDAPASLSATRRRDSAATVGALLHDLRQPLAAIQLLAESAQSAPTPARLYAISVQAQWLSELVEDVLSPLSSGGPRTSDIAEIVAGCVDRAQATAACRLTLSLEGDALALVRPVALARAIGCVLDNAVRAAGDGGEVRVGVRTDGADVVVTVEDDGPGLGRLAPQHSMGLTITRALLAECDGTFSLQPGQAGGATARLAVPALPAAAVAS